MWTWSFKKLFLSINFKVFLVLAAVLNFLVTYIDLQQTFHFHKVPLHTNTYSIHMARKVSLLGSLRLTQAHLGSLRHTWVHSELCYRGSLVTWAHFGLLGLTLVYLSSLRAYLSLGPKLTCIQAHLGSLRTMLHYATSGSKTR